MGWATYHSQNSGCYTRMCNSANTQAAYENHSDVLMLLSYGVGTITAGSQRFQVMRPRTVFFSSFCYYVCITTFSGATLNSVAPSSHPSFSLQPVNAEDRPP